MGTATQKYSLKWNDFTVNVASTFRDLHSRHDFVDVTLACADGSTLEAHKVILSSVSTYFRDILKTTPCKHPIIILKDTGRDEASAMLEFAYTGEVNVAQELLQSFLHMAKSFRIKGLDKVECPVDHPPPCQRVEAQTPSSDHWGGSAPPTRSHTPSSIHSQQDVKPTFSDHFLSSEKNHAREPHSLPNSRPPTREPSPIVPPSSAASHTSSNSSSSNTIAPPPPAGLNPRTPPPKRWKRSFDLTHMHIKKESLLESSSSSSSAVAPENYSRDRNGGCEYEPAKRFCDSSLGRGGNSESGQRLIPYPHSMPTSPTMFERGNEIRLAGLIRHHLSNDMPRSVVNSIAVATKPSPAHVPQTAVNATAQQPPQGVQSQVQHEQQQHVQSQPSRQESSSYDPVDYRCYNGKSNGSGHPENNSCNSSHHPHPLTPSTPLSSNNNSYNTLGNGGGYSSNGGGGGGIQRLNGGGDAEGELGTYRMVFRPESAPTVLDMSPDRTLSRPPSARNMDLSDSRDDDSRGHLAHSGDELSDGVSKAFSISADGLGRYSCDECGKIFKHPGSLQHHRHIHRGTHRCPSCGKAFSRRWDMERHINKSKYGCPANRFSTGSSASSPTEAQQPQMHHIHHQQQLVEVLSPAPHPPTHAPTIVTTNNTSP
eukprot:TRINITY_DN334_c1_g1_i1.p1 TRINITY_DN334_c1_g1~~TRINITY_DN334_c1_g1_i1.p1  ORF type:complete len:653 (-),score=140.48 TRINITY_DN334_c1_g1_i1:2088-4046(-)